MLRYPTEDTNPAVPQLAFGKPQIAGNLPNFASCRYHLGIMLLAAELALHLLLPFIVGLCLHGIPTQLIRAVAIGACQAAGAALYQRLTRRRQPS